VAWRIEDDEGWKRRRIVRFVFVAQSGCHTLTTRAGEQARFQVVGERGRGEDRPDRRQVVGDLEQRL